MSTVHVLIGIPGVGKSTWIRNNIASDIPVICPDRFLEEKYNYEWTPSRAAEAWADAYRQFAECLQANCSMVWDATFLRSIERSAVLHISKGFGYRTIAVVVQAPLEVCLERNRKRERRPVPDEKIVAMAEWLSPPDQDEGFDEIIVFDSQ